MSNCDSCIKCNNYIKCKIRIKVKCSECGTQLCYIRKDRNELELIGNYKYDDRNICIECHPTYQKKEAMC